MYTWFTCKVTFDRQGEDGLIKKVTEPFLVDALSFTEAEARIAKEVNPFVTGEMLIADIKRTKIAEMFYNEEGDKWYRCKINYLSVDENKGVEKRIAQNVMVQASSFKNAVDTLIDRMKGALGDYEIASVIETNILDVYPYEPLTATPEQV